MAAAQLSCCGAPAELAIGRPQASARCVSWVVTVTLAHRHYLPFEGVWDLLPNDRIWKLQKDSVRV